MRAPERLRKLSERLPKRGDDKRFWMHIPVGIIAVLTIIVSPVAAVMLLVTFLVYQVMEDWKIGDHSYIDINGFMAGIFAGIAILAIVQGTTSYWSL